MVSHTYPFVTRKIMNQGKLAFLHNCLLENRSLKSIKIVSQLPTRWYFDAVKEFQMKMLRAMINGCHHKIVSYQKCKEPAALKPYPHKPACNRGSHRFDWQKRQPWKYGFTWLSEICKKLDRMHTDLICIHHQLLNAENQVLQKDKHINTTEATAELWTYHLPSISTITSSTMRNGTINESESWAETTSKVDVSLSRFTAIENL